MNETFRMLEHNCILKYFWFTCFLNWNKMISVKRDKTAEVNMTEVACFEYPIATVCMLYTHLKAPQNMYVYYVCSKKIGYHQYFIFWLFYRLHNFLEMDYKQFFCFFSLYLSILLPLFACCRHIIYVMQSHIGLSILT